ncbi:hypothetical protein [Oceaniglobus trochenteri]|uniref:hypothetical protein n=1 Tax=Oceaniglobus trochenteri TaxID=2763260 RepID=UPI001D000CE9|nr:hypothetical protein [Oceaniglobus trochenteri]
MGLRRLLYGALTLCTLATGGATLWALSQHPFAAPFVERSIEDAGRVLSRHMALRATPEFLVGEVEQALADDDMDRLLIALETATAQGITLPRPLMERALVQAEAAESTTRRLSDCAACAWDIAQCKTVAAIAACALPVEITPLGDLNALRRAAADYGAGDPVDRLDLGLALAGLAATGAIVVTAGGSAGIKAGATVLRLARRAGALTPGLSRVLTRNADVLRDAGAIPGWLAGRVPLEQVADTAKLTRLSLIAGDLGTVARQTSPADTVVLLRHVDSAEDAARLARLSRVQGGQSRATIHILGKSRAFRALVRLSDLALATLALLGALAAQVVTLLLAGLRRVLRP